jgi:small redox-active disulfide protein 2
MEILVLGPGCTNCRKLEQDVLKALDELSIDAQVKKVTDLGDIASHGILMTPGLVIDGKVCCSGKVPDPGALREWILEASK